jgi:putative SOS response-associated peptidase YedK
MCNLYAVNSTQDELRRVADALNVDLGNFAGMPSVFPDYLAPVVRLEANGSRRLDMMRWGFPPVGPNPSYVTNVRNLSSNFWKGWLKPEWRVVVPATAFSEYMPQPDPITKKKPVAWFAVKDGSANPRPPFGFAGIWRPWAGTRGTKVDPVETVLLPHHRTQQHRQAHSRKGHAGHPDPGQMAGMADHRRPDRHATAPARRRTSCRSCRPEGRQR